MGVRRLEFFNGQRSKNHFRRRNLQDPYPMYARMHEGGPLHLLDVDGQWGAWAIFSHADCSSVAKDPRLSAKRAQQMLALLPPRASPNSKNWRGC